MTRHRPSAPYLAAIERRLGADLFGATATRSAAARLLAELAGPETERDYTAHLAISNSIAGAEGILDDLVTRHSLAGSLISRARTVAAAEPEPGGTNPLTDLERALTALDFAASRVPAEYRRGLLAIYHRVERIVLDVAGEQADQQAADEESRRAMEGPGRFVGAPEPVAHQCSAEMGCGLPAKAALTAPGGGGDADHG
jgi:hypothetical protein